MAHTIHGTKASEIGPTHKEDLLCQDGLCENCAIKIFVIHCAFFRDEFKVSTLCKFHLLALLCVIFEKKFFLFRAKLGSNTGTKPFVRMMAVCTVLEGMRGMLWFVLAVERRRERFVRVF